MFGVVQGSTPLIQTVCWQGDRFRHQIQRSSQRYTYHPFAVQRLVTARRASLRNAPIYIRGIGLQQTDLEAYFDFEFHEFVFRGRILVSELQEAVWFQQFSQRQALAVQRRRETIARRNEQRNQDAQIEFNLEVNNQMRQVRNGLLRGRPRGGRAVPVDELRQREAALQADRAGLQELREQQERAFGENLERQRAAAASLDAESEGQEANLPHNPVNRQLRRDQATQRGNRLDRVLQLQVGGRQLAQQRHNEANGAHRDQSRSTQNSEMEQSDLAGSSNNSLLNGSREVPRNESSNHNLARRFLIDSQNLSIAEDDPVVAPPTFNPQIVRMSATSTPQHRPTGSASRSSDSNLTDLIRQLPFGNYDDSVLENVSNSNNN